MRKRRKAFAINFDRARYPRQPESAQKYQKLRAKKKKTASESARDYHLKVADEMASKAPQRRKRTRPELKGKRWAQLPGKRVPGGRMGGTFKPAPGDKMAKTYAYIAKQGRTGARLSRTAKLVSLNAQATMPRKSRNISEKVNNMVIRNAKTVSMVDGVLDSGLKVNRRKNPVIPMRVTPTVVREPSPMTAPVSPNSYKIKIETGRKPGKATQMLRTVAGEVTKEFENTERDSQSSGLRDGLTKSFGFNQRLYASYANSVLTRKDLLDVIRISGHPSMTENALGNMSDKIDVYANVTKIRQSMKIVNENEYFPVKVKVHMVAPKTNWFPTENAGGSTPLAVTADSEKAIRGSFTDGANPTLSEGGTVPYWTQITSTESANGVASVIGTKECNIKDSDAFNQNFKIIRSFYRTLDPNDMIHLDHEHSYRSGVYVNQLYKATILNESDEEIADRNPLFTFFLIEAVGTTASLVNTTGNEQNHIGTSIGKLSFEHRTSASYIPDMTLSPYSEGVTQPIAVPMSFRSFAAVPATKTRIFNQTHSEVVSGTNYSLVATTRTQRQREGAGV